MPCGGCKGSKTRKDRNVKAVDQTIAPNTSKVINGYEMVIMEYIGKPHGPFRVNGLGPTNARYKFGKTQSAKFSYVYPHDVQHLLAKRNQDGSPWFKVVEPEPIEEKVKPEDFVGQEIEPPPLPKPEPEPQEVFVFDVQMKDLTVKELDDILLDKKYHRLEILGALVEQEINGKNRKTALKKLRDAIGELS